LAASRSPDCAQGSQGDAGSTVQIQRLHYGFGGLIPLPDRSDAPDVESAGGEGKWQHRQLKGPLTEVMLKVLATSGRGQGMIDSLKQRESAKGRKLEVVADNLGGPSGNVATGGDIDWRYPWKIRVGDDWRLQSAVATVAHELKHNEQWYVRFGKQGQVKDGDPVPMDSVEMASFEIPAKRTEATVAATMAAAGLQETGQADEVYKDLGTDEEKRREALDWSRKSASGLEEHALANASIRYQAGQDAYDWQFFLTYLPRYAKSNFTDLKSVRSVEALLTQDVDLIQPMNRLGKALGEWKRGEPEFVVVEKAVLQERAKLHPKLREVAYKHVDWFEAERKKTNTTTPGIRPDTPAVMKELEDAVARIVDLRDKSRDPQHY
jgi:hypothetical protein